VLATPMLSVEASGTAVSPSPWEEIAALVVRAQAGDRDALNVLILKFEKTVHALCLKKLRDPSEADELAQDVFLQVVRRIHQLRDPERFAGWLKQLTVRMALNHAGRRGLGPQLEADALEVMGEAVTTDPLADLIRGERIDRLRETLEDLKPLDRQILELFYLREMSLNAIAENLDVPVGTVKRRLHVARHRLKDRLIKLNEEVAAETASQWSRLEALLGDESVPAPISAQRIVGHSRMGERVAFDLPLPVLVS